MLLFDGKYVRYPRFWKEWWAYRRTFHAHVRDKLVCFTLKAKCLTTSVKVVVGDMEELEEVWETLDTCYNGPKKCIAKALELIVKFER